jgi:hypothetical protein
MTHAPAPTPRAVNQRELRLRKLQRGFLILCPFMGASPPPPPPPAELTDTFAGTAVELSSHTADSGATYAKTGNSGQTLSLDGSGALIGTTPAGSGRTHYRSNVTPATKNQYATFTLNISNTGKSSGYVTFRATSDDSFYAVGFNGGNTSVRLMQRTGSGDLTLQDWAVPGTGAYAIRVEITDASKIVLVDSVNRINYTTDNVVTAVGTYGISNMFADTSGWSIDNLVCWSA